MSNIRSFRAFSAELMKLAADIQDADIRSLLSERRGVEYLEGGRLLSNSAAEGSHYVTKMGNDMAQPRHPHYRHLREYGTTAAKGALTGIGILGAHNMMRGKFGVPVGAAETARAAMHARSAAVAGAGIAVADKALNKSAFVNEAVSSAFRSPTAELAEGRAVGSFHSNVHDTGHAPRPLQLGKKFRMA